MNRFEPRARSSRCKRLAVSLLATVTMTVHAAEGDDMKLGIDAFKQGRYDTARDAFTRAYAAGQRSPALYYNLGSAQFKLGAYGASADAFEHIANDPVWGALAQYNLGLIDEAEGRTERAQRHFQAAFDA